MKRKKIILLALLLILAIPNSFAQMQIFIRQSESMPRYVGGGATTLTLDCDSSDSVENIKQRINEKLALVPVGNLMLIFAGTILEDGRTLADYNIQKESTVHVFAVNLYPATSVEVGGTASVLSVAAPGANYTNKTVSTAPGFTGTLSVLPSGEVSIENAAPTGTYVIQINTSGGTPFQSFTLTVYNISYTVLFNANGGTGTMAVQPIDADSSANLITNTFTRNGYAFAGWNTAANGSGTSYANGASYTMNAAPNVTLYAQWTAINYTVTFATNGGTGTMSDQTIAFNASANLTSNAFTRWGYTFTGWNVNNTSYANQASYTMSAAGNVTLQAQWQPLQTPGTAYQIFVRQSDSMPRYVGGIGTTIFMDVDSDNTIGQIKHYLADLTLVPVGNLGLFFAGTILEDGRTLAYYNIQYESQIHVFAVNLYPATAVAAGGTASVLSVAAPGDNYFSQTVSTTPDFTGSLSILPSGEISIQNASPAGTYEIQIYNNIVIDNVNYSSLFQKFILTVKNNYAVTFDANGGLGSMATQTITSEAAANLRTNAFTRTGYTFAGWATTSGGAVAYTNSVSYTMGNADVTLFAKWTANNYNITFDANGGTGTMANQTIAYNASENLTTNAFTRTVYVFAGWSPTRGGDVAYADAASYTMSTAANVTLYAKWSLPIGGAMQIFVSPRESMPRYPGVGSYITLDVDGDASIAVVRQHLADAKYLVDVTSFPVGNLVLVFAGKILDNSKILADYNIIKESIVYLVAENLYPATAVAAGGTASVVSVAPPGGDYTDKTVSTTPDFTGSVSILPSGAISIQNAAPAGTYVIQINNTPGGSPFQSFTLTVYNNTSAITFDANGGAGTMANQSIAYLASANLKTNAFTRAGYTFAGWATTSTGAVAYANNGSYTMGNANVTLFAKWASNGTTTQLRPMHCDKTLRWLDEKIQATPVSGATQYRFEVIRTDNALDSRIVTSNSYLFNPATQLSGGLLYGKSYKIRVALFTGSWLGYGPECIVTAPAEPLVTTTKLRAFQCEATLLYMTQVVEAIPVYKATTYEFEVTSAAGTFVKSSPNYTFSLYYSVPGRALYGTAYSIRVRSKGAATEFTAYGDPCVVRTPIARMSDPIESDSIFNVKAFPNPFASHFSVDIESSSDAPVELKVYDMLGRTLEVRKATVSELSVLEVGRNYPSGVYNIVVSQAENVKSVRMMKR